MQTKAVLYQMSSIIHQKQSNKHCLINIILRCYVISKGKNIPRKISLNNRKVEFFVLSSDEIRAHTTKEGKIYISEGLIKRFSPSEQKAIFWHELYHQKHKTFNWCEETRADLFAVKHVDKDFYIKTFEKNRHNPIYFSF